MDEQNLIEDVTGVRLIVNSNNFKSLLRLTILCLHSYGWTLCGMKCEHVIIGVLQIFFFTCLSFVSTHLNHDKWTISSSKIPHSVRMFWLEDNRVLRYDDPGHVFRVLLLWTHKESEPALDPTQPQGIMWCHVQPPWKTNVEQSQQFVLSRAQLSIHRK